MSGRRWAAAAAAVGPADQANYLVPPPTLHRYCTISRRWSERGLRLRGILNLSARSPSTAASAAIAGYGEAAGSVRHEADKMFKVTLTMRLSTRLRHARSLKLHSARGRRKRAWKRREWITMNRCQDKPYHKEFANGIENFLPGNSYTLSDSLYEVHYGWDRYSCSVSATGRSWLEFST